MKNEELKAKEKFDRTFERCNKLISLYKSSSQQEQGHGNQDLLRAAIVLSVAALDAYCTDCFSEHFVSFIKNNEISDKMEKALEKYGLKLRTAVGFLRTDKNDAYSIIKELVQKYYERYTTQKIEIIDQLFDLYNLKEITKCAQRRAKDEHLLEDVEKTVNRRHKIVHEGDYDNKRIGNVAESDYKRIQSIKTLVDNMEYIINNKFSGYYS